MSQLRTQNSTRLFPTLQNRLTHHQLPCYSQITSTCGEPRQINDSSIPQLSTPPWMEICRGVVDSHQLDTVLKSPISLRTLLRLGPWGHPSL